jgi:M6 family metalloprotease-like protein
MTHYYKEASMGKFWLIRDVYPNLYVFQNNHDYYLPSSGRHIGYATRELLENLDINIDYSLYDKFAPNDPVNRRHPDGQVDFILIVFRFLLNTEPTTGSGIAALGGSNYNFGSTNQLVLDNKIISANHPGSGAIATQLTPWGYNIACHELGHYIFGLHRNHMGLFNLMNIGGNSFVSSDEREFAGWAPSPYVPTGNSTYILDDYGISGQYIKFSKGRYTYYLEYRKRNLFHL